MINPMGRPDAGILQALALVGQIGLVVVAPTIVGLLLGRMAGQAWGNPILLTIAGLLLGLVAGSMAAYRLALQGGRKKNR